MVNEFADLAVKFGTVRDALTFNRHYVPTWLRHSTFWTMLTGPKQLKDRPANAGLDAESSPQETRLFSIFRKITANETVKREQNFKIKLDIVLLNSNTPLNTFN